MATNKHITEQIWTADIREDGIYVVGVEDRATVLKMSRPDSGSDMFIAGYICELQAQRVRTGGVR